MKPLHETIAFPDHSFPYIMYTHTRYTSTPEGRGFNDLHWHEELQITLASRGALVIQVNGIDHELQAGQAILLNKAMLHMVTKLTEDGEYVSFNFPEKLLAFHSGSAMEDRYVLPYTRSSFSAFVISGEEPWSMEALNMLYRMKQIFDAEKSWGWEYDIAIRTVRLWLLLIANLSIPRDEMPKRERRQQERLQFMLSFIHRHYADPITLQEIADAAHLSLSECARSFKKTVRMTPYDYLIQYRIRKSTERLLETDDTITEIARQVGFNHVNHFIQSFKKVQGQTPGEFRKHAGQPPAT
ncbi:AraC family transcriptional regulator [Saccharibacillus sp. O16]|nr:AraC family transcriptional regulator [Saccharibacillus sp. O16]